MLVALWALASHSPFYTKLWLMIAGSSSEVLSRQKETHKAGHGEAKCKSPQERPSCARAEGLSCLLSLFSFVQLTIIKHILRMLFCVHEAAKRTALLSQSLYSSCGRPSKPTHGKGWQVL